MLTGNPVRDQVLEVRERRGPLRAEALEAFGLHPDRRTVVAFGGSQGAVRLNGAVAGAWRELSSRGDLQVLLLSGAAHEDPARRAIPSGGDLVARVAAFVDRIELAYACADLMVTRAGATTIAEVSACGLPAILVPYPHATGRHQEANARALERAGGATLIADGDLTPASLAERIEAVLDHDERLQAMGRGSASFGRPDAADALADLTAQVAAGSRR